MDSENPAPFRAMWFLFKWATFALIAFTIGVYWGR